MRFGALFEDKCTRNFRNMPCDSKVLLGINASFPLSFLCFIACIMSFYHFLFLVLRLRALRLPIAGPTARGCAAIEEALKYDNEIMIEENIDGFEVGCAVMNDKEGGEIIGRVDEIELACGFFDYTKKYTEVDSKIHMPARIDPHTESRIKDAARTIYKTLGCCGFARVDMFLTPTGKIVFNEVNTIPGFTSHSRFPKMLEGVGISFHDILENLITVADK